MQINEVAYKWAGQLARRTATRRIILHHAAAVTCTPQQVHQWHLANGWTGIGYHFFVRKDGTVYRGRPEDTVGAHAGNNNYDSLGVCFEGSFDRETMPDAQLRAGQELVAYLKQKYGISTVQRHSDVNATGCPGDNFPFDVLAGAQAAKPAVPAPVVSGTTLTLPLLTTASRGDTVRCVQAALTGLGYDAGGADGIYGTNTAAAVKRFQASRGIAADGLVGRDTWHVTRRHQSSRGTPPAGSTATRATPTPNRWSFGHPHLSTRQPLLVPIRARPSLSTCRSEQYRLMVRCYDLQMIPLRAALEQAFASPCAPDELKLRLVQLQHIHVKPLANGTRIEQELVGWDSEQRFCHFPHALLVEILQVLGRHHQRRIPFPHTL